VDFKSHAWKRIQGISRHCIPYSTGACKLRGIEIEDISRLYWLMRMLLLDVVVISLFKRPFSWHWNPGEGGGGGRNSAKSYTGRHGPEFPTLYPLLYMYHFDRKGTPFLYLKLEKGTPVTYFITGLYYKYMYIIKNGSLQDCHFHALCNNYYWNDTIIRCIC